MADTQIDIDDIFKDGVEVQPTEGDIALNSKLDTLYTHPFKVIGDGGVGKFFNIVTTDEYGSPEEVELELSPRVKISVVFIKNKNEINQIVLKKYRFTKKRGWIEDKTECIKISPVTFKKINGFINFLSSLDLNIIDERRIKLADDDLELDEETKQKIKTLLYKSDGHQMIEELLNNGAVTSKDIVNIGYRKEQLENFRCLLEEPSYLETYRNEKSITDSRPEIVWQYFLNDNSWIFGFGLDYRFLGILQKEAHIGTEDVAGKNAAIGDFILGCNDFTVLVELKRPDTPLFKNTKQLNRASTWTLSGELISSVSQILEQKAEWQLKSQTNIQGNFTDEGSLIKQKTIDPKSILIIGNRNQYEGEMLENHIKARTFELFRRDSRNIEIVTYDELYQRAKFIVEHSKTKK
jgi:hypothetical protein